MQPAGTDSPPLTLTRSEPLARVLRSDYALAQRRRGQAVWEVPPIFSLRRWCRDQWLQSWPSAQLLHPVQELVVWQRVIERDGATENILARTALARQARATAQLVTQYTINPASAPQYTDEQRAFARWHAQVAGQLQRQGWVTETEIPQQVTHMIRQGGIPVPAVIQLRWCGCPLTPLEAGLIEALRVAGAKIVDEPAPQRLAPVSAAGYLDDAQQFRALAAALRDLLMPFQDKRGQDGDQPPPSIVVACPDLEDRRNLIEAVFRPVLAPWLQLPGEGLRPVPWRFSGGHGLDQHPLIAVALTVCGLSTQHNSPDEISRLLLASILWTPAERALTAHADYALRKAGGTRISLAALLQQLPDTVRPPFVALHEQLRRIPRKALPSAWMAHFETRLAVLGWPGRRSLPSEAFQARERWNEALATFSSMDTQIGPISHAEAQTWLREILSSTPFTARADYLQPIQILSLQDAVGLNADHLFVVDATDDALPGPPRRQPFLATETLINAGVPAVTPATALEEATRRVAQLRQSSGTVQLSYAELDERGAERSPTTLFGLDLEWQRDNPKNDSRVPLTAAERISLGGPLTQLPDEDPVPPVIDPVAEGIFGGVAIFKDYVEAPFFAFCKYRLGIESLPEPTAGIPASAQGNIIHDVLEQAWGVLHTQETLKSRSGESLGQLVDKALAGALDQHLPADRYGRMLRSIERARLRDVILQWLAHEARRTEPFVVLERERQVELQFQGLALRLRIDRVDRVFSEHGERLLILDYKTGHEADVAGWKADSLKEPQLPLYATSAALGVAGITHVDGICFAHVKDGHPALVAATNWTKRLLETEREFSGKPWSEQLDEWRTRLSGIAQGFLRGEAGIDLSQSYRRSYNHDLLDLIREAP